MVSKIGFVTGTRAEYGLLKPVMDLVLSDVDLSLMLYVTGMHLSPEFGKTIAYIEKDGFKITEQIEILLSSDSPVGVSKSMGVAMIGFADAYRRSRPDIIVILGDRFEAFCAAASALVAGIPIVHIHGGELTEGAIDDSFRHSITKMSYLHFAATEEYRKRIIQMGEDPLRVFNVGSLGVENIANMKLMTKAELEASLEVNLGDNIALITYHPVTIAGGSAKRDMDCLLRALDCHPELFAVFTKANADVEGREINSMIDDYVSQRPERAVAFVSLGQTRYLSMMKIAKVVLGNSSSGIIEAPSFYVPTVNVGNRQRGRVRATSVFDCETTPEAIDMALKRALAPSTMYDIRSCKNPYMRSGTSLLIIAAIKDCFKFGFRAKTFYEGGNL